MGAAALVGATVAAQLATGSVTVQRGDTLSKIARTHMTTVDDLVAMNGIANPDLIVAGQVLEVPGAPVPGPDDTVHTVVPGDTLFSLARTYATSVEAIVTVNRLPSATYIRVGQVLIVNAGEAPPVTVPAVTVPIEQPAAEEPPVTEPPTTEPPAAEEPPATEPPATEPPATEPPATAPPATDPPATAPPATAPPATAPATPPIVTPTITTLYKVRSGDTIDGIAAQFGIGAQALLDANDFRDPTQLVVGAYINIPG